MDVGPVICPRWLVVTGLYLAKLLAGISSDDVVVAMPSNASVRGAPGIAVKILHVSLGISAAR